MTAHCCCIYSSQSSWRPSDCDISAVSTGSASDVYRYNVKLNVMAERLKERVWGWSLAGDCGFESFPPEAWVYVSLVSVACCLWDKPSTRPDEFQRLWCVQMSVIRKTSTWEDLAREGCWTTKKLNLRADVAMIRTYIKIKYETQRAFLTTPKFMYKLCPVSVTIYQVFKFESDLNSCVFACLHNHI